MIKITILLPTLKPDGSRPPRATYLSLLAKLDELSENNNSMLDCIVLGKYTNKSGQINQDHTSMIWVVCDESKLPEYRQFCAEVCRAFEQESVYMEYHPVYIELIEGN
jgi:hypothetical protein